MEHTDSGLRHHLVPYGFCLYGRMEAGVWLPVPRAWMSPAARSQARCTRRCMHASGRWISCLPARSERPVMDALRIGREVGEMPECALARPEAPRQPQICRWRGVMMMQARGHGAEDAPELMACRAAARDVVFGRVPRCLGEMACAGGVPILKTAACSGAWSSRPWHRDRS